MKIKITDTDDSKWFVRFYGVGGIVTVEDEIFVDRFYRPTLSEHERICREIDFSEPISLLFIPVKSAERYDD